MFYLLVTIKYLGTNLKTLCYIFLEEYLATGEWCSSSKLYQWLVGISCSCNKEVLFIFYVYIVYILVKWLHYVSFFVNRGNDLGQHSKGVDLNLVKADLATDAPMDHVNRGDDPYVILLK